MFKSRRNRIASQAAFSVSTLLSVTLAVAQAGPSSRPVGTKSPSVREIDTNGAMPAAAVFPAGKPVVTKYGNLTITETALPTPNLWVPDAFKVSPDCKRIAVIGFDGKKSYVVCDKYKSPLYDTIHLKSLLFSADGKRLAFATKQNGKTGIVLTDGAMPLVDDLGGWMGFGEEGSKHFAFIGVNNKKAVMYYDGKPSAPYDAAGMEWFSPDGSHFAFLGRKGTSDVIVLDGTERQTYTGLIRFLYSPNADRLAVLVRNGNKTKMILDGNASKEYDVVDPKEMTFSPDGKRFAYTAQTGGKQFMVVPGEFEKEYELVGAPLFSPDSKRLTYFMGRNGKYVTILDGVEGKEYDFQQALTFSPDSKHLGCYAETNDVAHYVIDGVEGKTDSAGSWVNITWSPVGDHYSYIASKGAEHFAVIDDVKSKSYAGEQEFSKVTWSADGKHVAHLLSPDRKQMLVLIDGKYETPLFNGIIGAMVAFDDKDKAHCIVKKDGRYYHLEIAINP